MQPDEPDERWDALHQLVSGDLCPFLDLPDAFPMLKDSRSDHLRDGCPAASRLRRQHSLGG